MAALATEQTPQETLSPESIVAGYELQRIGWLREALPFTIKLFPRGTEYGRVPLPSVEAANEFARTYLQPLGATTMTVKSVPGAATPAEEIEDLLASGVIPVATEGLYQAHDYSDHLVGAMTLPETTATIFRQIARSGQQLREVDPEAAKLQAGAVAYIFDHRTSSQVRFLRGVRGYDEKPMILTHFHSFLKHPERVPDKDTPSLAVIEAAIERAIDDVPSEDGETYEAPTKLGRWAEWESKHLPNYTARIHEVLAQQPQQERRRGIASLLGRHAQRGSNK